MKSSKRVLALSLFANVGLLAALVLLPDAPSSPPTPVASPKTSAAPIPPAISAQSHGAVAADESKPWAFLRSKDTPSLVERLRAAGCPPAMLRMLVVESYKLRRQGLTFDGNDTPYWKDPPSDAPDPKVAAEIAQLEREASTLLQQLGPAVEETDEMLVVRERRFGGLPAGKISQVEAVLARHSERLNALMNSTPGVVSQAQMAQYAELERRLHDEVAQVLTPAELLEYDLRNGPTSTRLRSALTGFNPTEAEYRALFALYQAQEARAPSAYGPRTPETAAALAAAQRQTDEEVKALLTPERFAQYEQASRPEYQQLNRLVTRLELPLSAAAQVVAVQREIQQRAGAIRTDAALSAAARAEQLAALGQEATAKITSVIGARGLEGYWQYGGEWLQQFQPRPGAKAR